MAVKELRLKPRYLPFVEDTRRHRFQLEILRVQTQSEDCLIVEAPTGAGKTQVLGELADSSRGAFAPRLLVISPTNALSSQIAWDIERENPSLKVRRWAANEFASSPCGRNIELVNDALTSNVIVSNPDILHLFTQNYYARRCGRELDTRQRTFDDAMARFGVHFFDEYHSYDERMLASVISYMLKARSLSTCKHHRYVFLSATPNKSLPSLLREYGFAHRLVQERDTEDVTVNGRPIKRELLVRIVTGDMVDHISELPPPGTMKPRTLVFFDSFVKEEKFLSYLLANGYKYRTDQESDIVTMTGRDTKSTQGQQSWDKAPVIIATSKAELGLNIDDLEQLMMELGRYASQFIQRFGRAGRSRDSRVIIAVPSEFEKLVADVANEDYEGLVDLMSKLSSEKPFSKDKCMKYVGYQLASAELHTNKLGLRNIIKGIELPSISNQARSLLLFSERRLRAEYSSDFADDVDDILRRLVVSFCLLRGQSTDVDCIYPRGKDSLRTKDNLLYVLCRTECVRSETQDGPVYTINGFLDEPRDAVVSFPGFPNPVSLKARRGYVSSSVWHDYVGCLVDAMVKKSLSGEKGDALSALEAVLNSIDPDMMAPLEVNIDDQFI